MHSVAARRLAVKFLRVLLSLTMVAMIAPSGAGAQDPTLIGAGIVTDAETSLPIPDVSISVSYRDPSIGDLHVSDSTSTALDGSYAVYDRAAFGPGQYSYTVAADGYVYEIDERSWDGETPLVVDFALERAKCVATGTVTAASTNAPIEKARVTLEYYDSSRGAWFHTGIAYTDSDGAYSVDDQYGYGPGTYRLLVSADGYVWDSTTGDYWDGTDPLNFDFALKDPLPVVLGTAADAESGDRLEDALVLVEFFDVTSADWLQAGQWRTASDGSFTVVDRSAFGAGQYRVRVVASGYVSQSSIVDWNGSSPVTADFLLVPSAPLARGTVRDKDDGTALAEASVRVEFHDPSSDEWWEIGSVVTDSAGGYVFDYHYGAGEYRFFVTKSGYVDDEFSRTWDAADCMVLDVELQSMGVPPVAEADAYSIQKNGALDVPVSEGVLTNDYDQDGDVLSVEIVENTAHGALNLRADGSFTYKPTVGWIGTDRFKYRIADEFYASQPVEVTISVRQVAYVSLGADDRYGTAVLASRDVFDPGQAGAVVIATGTNWPDALGAAALAGAYDAPVLLTKPDVLPASVVAEIKRLQVRKAFIIGSTAAVSSDVQKAVATLVGGSRNVTRLEGDDRYATASVVADEVKSKMTALGRWDGRVFVATGRNFPDALAASPLAASEGIPILLVSDTLPSPVVTRLKALQPDSILVLGSTSAVSPAVYGKLTQYGAVSRLWGDDRYETGAEIAAYSARHGLGWDGVAIATGQNFPDALAGGTAQGLNGSLILLTPSTSLNPLTRRALTLNKGDIFTVRFLGAASAVSESVRAQIKEILG